jgi:Lrp/AsnC family transcriptional regulator, leucine-responsive regulatory protein
VVTGGLDLLVRLRVRDHTHLRELLLTKIFQISGVQRTETFLSLADVEKSDFAMAMLEQMSELRDAARESDQGGRDSGASPRAGTKSNS